MIFFGHIGTSIYLANRLAPGKFDGWRALIATAFCAYLPDLIDKPIFWLGLAPANTGRIWAHTLLFSLLFCVLCRYWITALWPWALATPFHLLCDRMWSWPHTLFWPFMGLGFEDKVPLGVTHWHVVEFLSARMKEDLWGLVFDTVAEMAGLVFLLLLLRTAFYKSTRTN